MACRRDGCPAVGGILTNALLRHLVARRAFALAPYFHNSIGLLTEAASARLMTPSTVAPISWPNHRPGACAVSRSPRTFPGVARWLWRPADIVQMEMIAARSVLSLAANYRSSYLQNYYELNNRDIKGQQRPGNRLRMSFPGQGRDRGGGKEVEWAHSSNRG